MSTNVSHMPHNGMMSQQFEQCDPPVCPDVSNISVPMSYGIPAQHDSSLIPPSLSNSHGTNFYISNTVSSYSYGNSVVPCSQDVQNCSIFQSHLVPSSNLGLLILLPTICRQEILILEFHPLDHQQMLPPGHLD